MDTALSDFDKAQKYYRLQFFEPYPYQHKFFTLKAANGRIAKARCLLSANQIGKTLCEGFETALHATGLYPDWWQGVRLTGDQNIVCSGVNSYRTRDLIQKELLGTSNKDDAAAVGSGWIPKHCITGTDRKPGIPGAVEKIHVERTDGKSVILLLGYEDGPRKVMGERITYGWCDEEPPQDVWSQYVRGTIATNGYLALTFTPENGMTQVVYRFRHECPQNYAIMQATWEDAPHITPERRAELMAEMLPMEVEMRSRGEPLVGDSMIFPISDNDLMIDPFEIPKHWPMIIGIDFGGDHPFAVVKMAFDPSGEKKKAYVTDVTKIRRQTIAQESSIVKGMGGDIIPVAWPHDGNKLDKQSGKPMADLYRKEGVKMLDNCFSNPSEPFKEENTGGQGVEVGLKRMYFAMTEGRVKVFKHNMEWFKEKGSYHKKDGDVVRLNDDLMSATRYAYQAALNNDDSFRFAKALKRDKDFFRPIKYDLSFVR